MEKAIIKKLEKFDDERGWLAEFWRNDDIKYSPAMGYISMTKPGVVRGPHEHKDQTDFFVFTGPGDFEIYLWDRRDGSPAKDELVKEIVGESNPCIVIVPPGIVHGYKCVTEYPAYSINLADSLYRGQGKKEEVDEIRWEKREDSPYKII